MPLTTGVWASFFLNRGCLALRFAEAISAGHGIALFSRDPNSGKSSCDRNTNTAELIDKSGYRVHFQSLAFGGLGDLLEAHAISP